MTKKLVYTGLSTALIAAFTMFPSIPTGLGGYINFGDSIIIAVSFSLGFWGIFAAGIGAMLADIILGYMSYAIGTLVIKSLMATVCVLIFKAFYKMYNTEYGHINNKNQLWSIIVAAIGCELVMVGGYFAYEALLMSVATATAGITGNLIQMGASVVIGFLLCNVFNQLKITDRFNGKLL